MEEDIKWLEDYVKRDREVRSLTEFESDFDQFCERHCKSIENLLTRYKQLEQENNNFKEAAIINDRLYKEVCNKNKELKESCKSCS